MLIAERLGARQLILHQISRNVVTYVCMYVCVTLKRNAIEAAGADGRPFVVHFPWLAGVDNEDDEVRSRRLATLRR